MTIRKMEKERHTIKRLDVREYHNVMNMTEVTFGTPYTKEYEVYESILDVETCERNLPLKAMYRAAKENGWDYVQFYDSDRLIFYHAFVIKDETGEEDAVRSSSAE